MKPEGVRIHHGQMIKAAVVALLVIALFFAGMPVAEAAILGGALMLITRAVKAAKVYREIDGSLLIMFAGLFVVVAGAEKVLLTPAVIGAVLGLHLDQVWVLTAVTAVLSNFISNVPAVLVLKPFVQSLADQQHAWLVIAMSSTVAGNLTVVGSVANLIVVERARSAGIEISFGAYCRAGVPLTLLSLAFGTWWLSRAFARAVFMERAAGGCRISAFRLLDRDPAPDNGGGTKSAAAEFLLKFGLRQSRRTSLNPGDEFRKQAAQCARVAASMRDPHEKSFWNKLAQRWLACAAHSESQYAAVQEAKISARGQRKAA